MPTRLLVPTTPLPACSSRLSSLLGTLPGLGSVRDSVLSFALLQQVPLHSVQLQRVALSAGAQNAFQFMEFNMLDLRVHVALVSRLNSEGYSDDEI